MGAPASDKQCRHFKLHRRVISQVTFTGARSPCLANSEPNEDSFVFQLFERLVQ
jgi:hypothetical protein